MKKILLIIFVSISFLAFSQKSITWGVGMNISTNTYGNIHPRMTLDRVGNPLVIWSRLSDGAVFLSRWNGTMFTTPVKLNPSWLPAANASWMGPDIASKGDTVYVVMKRTPEMSDTNHIYILTSFDGGVSFSAPLRVDYINDSMSRFPTITVDASGNPIVAFMKFNSAFMKARWVVTRSNDYGKTFSVDSKASGYSGPNAEACDCCPGAIVSSGNVAAMIYRDNLSNIRDIWTGVSTDNSVSFGNGFASDKTNWMIMSCPSSGPDGVIVGDSLYSVFLSGAGGVYRTYLSTSSLSSAATGSVNKLKASLTGLGQQNYPRIASNGRAMAIVWKQTVSGNAQLPIMFTRDIKKGFGSGYDTVDLGDITNADIALGENQVFVIWQDDNSGTVKCRMGSYSPITSISEVKLENVKIFPNPASTAITLLSDNNLQIADVNIVNLLGETILTQTIHGKSIYEIDVSGLSNGIYFIVIKSGDKFITQKFIKE